MRLFRPGPTQEMTLLWLLFGREGATVFDDFDRFQRYQAAGEHLIQDRQEGLDLLLAIHDLDHQRQVQGEPQDFGGVEAAGFSETHGATQYRGTGEVQFARLQHDGLVERLVFPPVAFTDEDSQEHGFVRKLHSRFRVEGYRCVDEEFELYLGRD